MNDLNKPEAPDEEELLITFSDGRNQPLVTVKVDGTVIVHNEGDAPVAARTFWEAVQLHGQTIIQQNQRLREYRDEQAKQIEKLTDDVKRTVRLAHELQQAQARIKMLEKRLGRNA